MTVIIAISSNHIEKSINKHCPFTRITKRAQFQIIANQILSWIVYNMREGKKCERIKKRFLQISKLFYQIDCQFEIFVNE